MTISWDLLSWNNDFLADILAFLAGVDDDIDVPDWGFCPWWRYEWYAYALRELCLKFGWNAMSLKASRTPSKIDDICRFLAGIDEDFDVPDWGLCPWWRFGWSPHALMELCLKFGLNLLSLKVSRTPSKICDIFRVFAGVDDELMFLTGAGLLDDVLDGLHMP